ncbi:MAG: WYL domain-containing protein, partial [Bacteroidales bacterium]
NEHYKYCFGIISPNGLEAKEIILSFDPFQGKYIKSLPLHETQEILADNESELKIKLKLCTSFDFIMEILSFGENVKVIAPESLINEMKRAYHNAINLYGEE